MNNFLNARYALVIVAGLAFVLFLLPAAVKAADEDWDRLGSIEVDRSQSNATQNFNVLHNRQMQRISFRARDNNVRCDFIRVRFLNGQTQVIDHIRYPEDERRAFDLYGDDRRVANIHFECRPGGNSNRARLVVYGR